ncbi:hypothetical protein TrLO_g241 [Triparma laevis f. longispina]|uniref:Uncharacterized protein n=1 Tax=Triparma laevis f. longispina TaxID=1714387 RepID=A0A9W7A0F7_9STRA|nr:hypothetical protein TrLO_g241 [Triparma laevis f. longispina]
MTLRLIGQYGFWNCSSLEVVELKHTKVGELGHQAFFNCGELKSMTVLAIPTKIDVGSGGGDVTSEIISYLRFLQSS